MWNASWSHRVKGAPRAYNMPKGLFWGLGRGAFLGVGDKSVEARVAVEGLKDRSPFPCRVLRLETARGRVPVAKARVPQCDFPCTLR